MSGDASARQALWRQITDLLERDVGDIDEAIAACVSILDENPEDDQALERLSRLYELQGRQRDRLDVIERRLALRGPQDPERLTLLRQIASLLEGPLGDAAGALERWREVLERAPSDAAAIAAIERFLSPATDAGLRLTAAQLLEPIYEKARRYPELAGHRPHLRRGAGRPARAPDGADAAGVARGDPPRRSGGGARHSRRCHPRRADRARAAGTAGHLRAVDGDGARRRGHRALSRDQPRRHGRGGQAAARSARSPPRRPGRATRRSPPTTTAASWTAFPRTTPRWPRWSESTGPAATIPALYEILVRRAELARDTAGERALRVQVGEVAETKLERLDDAIAAYERVLEIAPADRTAAQALDRLYTRAERWTDLTRLFEEQLRQGSRPERELVDVRFRLARIEQDQRGDREAALEHLQAGPGRRSRSPRGDHDARGDAGRHRRPGRRGDAAGAGLRRVAATGRR